MAPGAPGPPPTQVHSDAVQKALAPEPPSAAGAGRLGGAGGAGGAPGFGEDGEGDRGGLSRAEQGRVSLPPSARLPGQARAGVHQLCPARLSTSPATHGRPCHRLPTAAVPSGPADPPPSRPIQVLHGPRPLSSLKCRFRFRSGEAQGRCGRLLTDLLASTRGPCPSVFLKGDQAVLPPWSSLLWVGQATGAAAPRLRPAPPAAPRPHMPAPAPSGSAPGPRGLEAPPRSPPVRQRPWSLLLHLGIGVSSVYLLFWPF